MPAFFCGVRQMSKRATVSSCSMCNYQIVARCIVHIQLYIVHCVLLIFAFVGSMNETAVKVLSYIGMDVISVITEFVAYVFTVHGFANPNLQPLRCPYTRPIHLVLIITFEYHLMLSR